MTLTALEGVPEIGPGQPLDQVLLASLKHSRVTLADGDVVALCQKIVSKSERRFVELDTVEPGARAVELAQTCGKDARVCRPTWRRSFAATWSVRSMPTYISTAA